MLKSFFGHRGRYKKFNYKPRYYDPKKDKSKRERIKFESQNRARRAKQTQRIIFYAVGLGIIFWVILYL
ncbi:MAG: hypothetical protein ACQETE_12975 [Bacteroidota bacterium]|jgi:hypothetical protein